MLQLQILRFPHPFLRNKGRFVEAVTPELVELAQHMLQLMYDSSGVGLAAVQIGKPLALLTADTRTSFQSPYYTPELSENSASQDLPEGDKNRKSYERKSLSYKLESQVSQPLILFNPEIAEKKGEVWFQEGCLSFPSYYAEVKRAEIVTVKALNTKGEEITIKTDGLLSICLQHEIDHLHGKLFIDHLSPIKSRRLKEEIKKHGYPDSSSSFTQAQ